MDRVTDLNQGPQSLLALRGSQDMLRAFALVREGRLFDLERVRYPHVPLQIMRVNMITNFDRFFRDADRLSVFVNQLALSNIAKRYFVAAHGFLVGLKAVTCKDITDLKRDQCKADIIIVRNPQDLFLLGSQCLRSRHW